MLIYLLKRQTFQLATLSKIKNKKEDTLPLFEPQQLSPVFRPLFSARAHCCLWFLLRHIAQQLAAPIFDTCYLVEINAL